MIPSYDPITRQLPTFTTPCNAMRRRIGVLAGEDSLPERVVGYSGVDLGGRNLPVSQVPLGEVEGCGSAGEACVAQCGGNSLRPWNCV